MAHSITEYLDRLQQLTNTNLQILDTINKAFHSRKEHLVANIDGTDYVIPSYLYLESKVDQLQQDLENIVNAPKTGEAFTYFDGTTQRIELAGYSTTPNSLNLNLSSNTFSVKTNNIFKDFLSPMPYVRLDIQSVSNATKTVNVKKVCIKNTALWEALGDVVGEGRSISYSDFTKKAYVFEEGTDYIEYDTTNRLPFRAGGAEGKYGITNISDYRIDGNFDEFYNIVVDSDLVYYKENGTFQYDLQVGDRLVTEDNVTELEIIALYPNTREMELKVLHGGYVDLTTISNTPTTANNTLKFLSQENYNETKYVDVPLEEDQYICIFIAAVNDTTNAQAPWGTGIALDTYSLYTDENESFENYYNKYVNNVGDILFSITSMMSGNSLTNLSESELLTLTQLKPEFQTDDITVTQINKHLNDSASIQHIRDLYSQKSSLKSDLKAVQKDIDDTISTLSTISFDDTSNSRRLYTSRLSDLNARKKELTESINNTVEDIVREANSADVPIEDAKYRIRGFVNLPESLIAAGMPIDIIRIDVQYRYRNSSSFTGNAETIGDNKIYSDWCVMPSEYRWKQMKYEAGEQVFEYENSNDNINEPSFNQIDIPITQGEYVDLRVRYVYNIGFPFAKTLSDWSDIIEVPFPVEFKTDVTIVQIIDENNEDLKKGQFAAILDKNGIIEHCDDKLEDQDLIYFHQPQHIASGFYTPERRVVPLADKLKELSSDILSLKAEVEGQQSENLIVYISDSQSNLTIQPYIMNEFRTVGFNNNENLIEPTGNNENIADIFNNDVAYSQLNIGLYNNGDYELRLYSMFPGSPNQPLGSAARSAFSATDYSVDQVYGVWMQFDGSPEAQLQKYNQILYFRMNDIFTNAPFYNTSNNQSIISNLISGNQGALAGLLNPSNYQQYFAQYVPDPTARSIGYASLHPYVGQLSAICLDEDAMFLTIKPGESVNIPLSFYYSFIGSNPSGSVSRTIEFDVRTSLYKDPTPFRVRITANANDSKSFTVKKTDNVLRMGDTNKSVAYSPVINKKVTSL